METGERVYHTPNSPWYRRTEIDTEAGERLFCTEREALEAGWRAPKSARSNPTATAEPTNGGSGCDLAVNINKAGTEELETLPGIGEVLAQRIVEYRNENGDFLSIEELDNVRGIGEKTLSKIMPCVVLHSQ